MSPNEHPNDSTTAPQQWLPPRGIYYEFNRQRPAKPYMLRWREVDRPKSLSFATEAEREKAARILGEKRAKHGSEILNFDPREWRRWLEFKDAAGGADPFDILREWQAARGANGMPLRSVTVADAVGQYWDFRSEQRLSKDTFRHINKHVRERFVGHFGPSRLIDVTPTLVSAWLKSLRSTKGPNAGGPVEPVTKKHHRKDVSTFFDFCITQGWITRNPCDLVAVPHIEEENVVLLTVDEGRALFSANEGERVVGRLALEAFGFLRASRAAMLPMEHVNFAERGILLRGEGRKGTKARYRQGHPDNLWPWLARAPEEMWTMNEWEYRHEKAHAFTRAGLAPSDNRLRKTCISAHLAWLKNQPLTSYLAQHRHTATTDIYLGVMDEAAGAAWFRIGPRFL